VLAVRKPAAEPHQAEDLHSGPCRFFQPYLILPFRFLHALRHYNTYLILRLAASFPVLPCPHLSISQRFQAIQHFPYLGPCYFFQSYPTFASRLIHALKRYNTYLGWVLPLLSNLILPSPFNSFTHLSAIAATSSPALPLLLFLTCPHFSDFHAKPLHYLPYFGPCRLSQSRHSLTSRSSHTRKRHDLNQANIRALQAAKQYKQL